MNQEHRNNPEAGETMDVPRDGVQDENVPPANHISAGEEVSPAQDEIKKPNGIECDPETMRRFISEEMDAITRGQIKVIKDQIAELSNTVQKNTALCKESLEYCQRYERNTVSVLQEENKKKDKYITGILLVDLLKPVAEIYAKIEKRIKKCQNEADRKFLLDLLDDITDVAIDEYGVEIHKTEKGQERPENVSKVDDVQLTSDEKMKGKVAESLCSSWVLNGKLIQKERVIVYRYEHPETVPEYEGSDSPRIAQEKEEKGTENVLSDEKNNKSENEITKEVSDGLRTEKQMYERGTGEIGEQDDSALKTEKTELQDMECAVDEMLREPLTKIQDEMDDEKSITTNLEQ